MSEALSSRERILAALSREPVDHVPCCGFFNPLDPVLRRGHTWNFPWAADTPATEQLRYQVEELGLDQVVYCGANVTRQHPEVTAEVRVEGDVLRKIYHTPAGDLQAAVRYNDLWPHGEDIPFFSDFNVGHFVEPWLQSREDLDCLRFLFELKSLEEALADSRAGIEAQRALADRFDLALYGAGGLGLTGAQHLFGVRELCLLTIEDPELVDAYLALDHEKNLLLVQVMGELGVDIFNRNGFYETADFYSPAMLGRFLTERLNAEARLAHGYGMKIAYTAHTGVMPILDHLAGLEVDSVVGIDLVFHGVEPGLIRDKLAATKAFWTGPSSTFHIWKGPEATREGVRLAMETFGPTGLILSPCVSFHSIMPWESTLAMIEEWKRLR
jgi:hypothetical protein